MTTMTVVFEVPDEVVAGEVAAAVEDAVYDYGCHPIVWEATE